MELINHIRCGVSIDHVATPIQKMLNEGLSLSESVFNKKDHGIR